ncbi:MAG: urease subunit gamma [Candidatus Nitrosomaritimum yanchengensis]
MKIIIQVKGEKDLTPFTKIFDYEKNNEFIFFDSLDIIKKKILRNQKLNINETLALFSGFIVISLKEKKSIQEIQKQISQLLLSHQVLIGVPEILKKLTFLVTTDFITDKEIVIESPIPCESVLGTMN